MAHDRYCPLDPLPEDDCVICADLVAAERDGYARGWLDGANGRPASP